MTVAAKRGVTAALVLLFAAACAGIVLRNQADAQVVGYSAGSVPQPAAVAPPSEVVGGLVGTMDDYARGDHTHPRITRSAVTTTDASGNWSVTWSTSMTVTPVVLPIAVNAGSQPVSCNVTTRTTTGATGKCWGAQSTLLNLSIVTSGLTLLPYGNSGAGVTVQIVAIPPTQ